VTFFTQRIKQHAYSLGADLCGIAGVSRFVDTPPDHHPTELLPDCKSVVALACQFPGDQIDVAGAVYTNARDRMVEKLDRLSAELAAWINEQSGKSLAMPSTRGGAFEADRRYRAPLSMKHAAMLAGLGKIGQNTLLINNRFGNMIWLGAVLTTLELAPDPLAEYDACLPDCNLCVNSCPSSALETPMMQQHTCYMHAFRPVENRSDGKIEIILCNTCRLICPHAFGFSIP
jgi:epoxyqueuosine reductase